jgi:hypothetical protein
MPRLRAWFSRLLGFFQKKSRDAEMAEEIQQHLDRLTERNIAAGMWPKEARNAALRQFGGVEQIKESGREQRVWMWAEEFLRDVRFALRQLRKAPAFTVTALATIAICLGANLAIFAVIDSILLRPLPFPRSDRLVTIFNIYPKSGVERARTLNRSFTRLVNLTTKPRGDERIGEEIEPHTAARSEENILVGIRSEEDRRQACLEFAAVEANPEGYHAEKAAHS